MLHMQLAALALAAITVTASGCGGSSKSGSTTTAAATTIAQSPTTEQATTPAISNGEIKVQSGKPLARATWTVKANEICRRTNVQLSSITLHTEKDFGRLLPQAAGYKRVEAIELSKLVPPKALASDWNQILTDMVKIGEFGARAAKYAQVGNWKEAKPILDSGNVIDEQMTALIKRAKLKVCAEK